MTVVTYTFSNDPLENAAGTAVAGYLSGQVSVDTPFASGFPAPVLAGSWITYTPAPGVGVGATTTIPASKIFFGLNTGTGTSLDQIAFLYNATFNSSLTTVTTDPSNGYIGGFLWSTALGDAPNGDVVYANLIGPNSSQDLSTGAILGTSYASPNGFTDAISSCIGSIAECTPAQAPAAAPGPSPGFGVPILALLVLALVAAKARVRLAR